MNNIIIHFHNTRFNCASLHCSFCCCTVTFCVFCYGNVCICHLAWATNALNHPTRLYAHDDKINRAMVFRCAPATLLPAKQNNRHPTTMTHTSPPVTCTVATYTTHRPTNPPPSSVSKPLSGSRWHAGWLCHRERNYWKGIDFLFLFNRYIAFCSPMSPAHW